MTNLPMFIREVHTYTRQERHNFNNDSYFITLN
jgi:hypothetical protein